VRVAFVTNFCPHYRVKTFSELTRRLDVEFLFFSRGTERFWNRRLGVQRGGFPHTYLRGWEVAGSRITPTLPLRLARGRYQAVLKCINGRFALPATYLVTRLKRIPFILWTGIWYRIDTPTHRLAYPITRWIYRHADAVVVYGSHVERFLIAEGVDPSRIFLAPHAVDNAAYCQPVSPAERAAVKRSLAVANGDRLVLYVGRLETEKGLTFLIDALAGLGRRDVVLALVGDGSQRQALASHAAQAGIVDRVRFAGSVAPTELRPYYAAADLLVLPSITTARYKELWGLVVNEAFNQGLPVVATDAVGAAAGGLVEDGVTGLVVPERDGSALAAALSRLLGDEALRSTLGAAARRRVEAWSNQAMVDGFVAGVESAIAGRKR
jgi:glycosyltransferase involved in cell wall biosynthesis